MSKWYSFEELKRARTPMPLDSVTGLPDNHVITVVERVISVDDPELIQNNVRTDTFTLNLDAEYDDLNIVVIFTKPNNINVKVAYNGTPTHIPGSAMEVVGSLACSVVGIDADGEVRAVTKAAPDTFQVVKSGAYDGSVTSDDAELLGQILQAVSDAEAAITEAETATTAATNATSQATSAATSANQAASSANTAASSANSAAARATSAAVNAENAYDTLQPYMATIEALKSAALEYDQTTGTYTRSSVEAFVRKYRDAKVYGYRQYKSTKTDLDKLIANKDIVVPIPGTSEVPADDDYIERGPFFWYNVNGKVDPYGNLDVTAVEYDAKFSLTDPDGDVATLTPTLYYHIEETDDYIDTYICDSPLAGFKIQPHGETPDGKPRPFMLHAKYAASQDADGRIRSVSGAKPLLFVSHNSLITLCDNADTGYSAYNSGDDWYIKTMFMLKYASKNSQAKFNGCTGYSYQYKASVAESDTNRVIIAKALANNLVVGSCCSLGTNPNGEASRDRGNSDTRDIFHLERITKIESYDSNNSAVYFEGIEPFTTTTNSLLSTMPWWTGKCDSVQGDGSPASGNSSKYPFTMQGIELMLGMYEIMGNVVVKNTGDGWKAYLNHDSRNEKTAYTASVYDDIGLKLPTDSADSWKYPSYCKDFGGLISSDNTGGSQSTGMCDGIYTNNLSTTGEREWLSFGRLWNGAAAGLFYAHLNDGLSDAWWHCGSRLSFIGRSRGESA